jgi:hypothetical protein
VAKKEIVRCSKRRTNGLPCTSPVTPGTDSCYKHSGLPKTVHKARGQVVVELEHWGLSDKTRDPGMTLLQLMTQSAVRAEFYSSLLQDAYEAAERLREGLPDVTAGQVPGQLSNSTDAERAATDLDRIFTTGGVATLIGYKYGTAGQDGNLYVTEEAIRGLVQLEGQERDRCAGMATKAIAAGLAERQVRLAEQTAAQFVTTMKGVLADLGLDPESAQVRQVVSERLSAIAS